MQQKTEAIDISDDEYNELVKRVENKSVSDEDWKLVLAVLRAYAWLIRLVNQQKTSIKKLKALIFGKKTEKHIPTDQGSETKPKAGDPGPLDPTPQYQPALGSTGASSTATTDALPPPNPKPKSDLKPKAPGHGRRPGDSWKNATVVVHSHTELKPGDSCPKCRDGTLYLYDEPAVWVRCIGQPPLVAEVNHLERLRCSPCGALITAQPPEELRQNPTATPEARATAAMIKYQAATPFNRFADMQRSFGHPIPRTRIWSMCSELGATANPVIHALIDYAAQGEVVQNDDTTVRILELMKENKVAKKSGIELPRTGMYTTAIVSKVGPHKIHLFFSSRKHAGENLTGMLLRRDPGRPPPTQVCDASSMNTSPGTILTEVEICHDHARRGFYEIKEAFPRSCQYALDEWGLIYEVDAEAKLKKLSDEQRLLLHQERSGPVMERIHAWCIKMFVDKRVEPNGHLGKAMQYVLDHYEGLTLFLRKPGVPLSNCECEQTLKTAIGVRRLAYFFKTLNGARVADTMFTLIATCKAAQVNLFEYLVALQRNETRVAIAPTLWFPWNYHEQLVQG